MSLLLDLNSQEVAKEDAKIHLLPCNLQYDGEANIARYFDSSIRNSDEEMTASFRGRPLNGKLQDVPAGYTGIVLKEVRRPFNEEEDRNLTVTHKFRNFHYWNLDRKPSSDDKLHQAMEWIDLAKILHKPVNSEDSQRFQLDSQKSVIDK